MARITIRVGGFLTCGETDGILAPYTCHFRLAAKIIHLRKLNCGDLARLAEIDRSEFIGRWRGGVRLRGTGTS